MMASTEDNVHQLLHDFVSSLDNLPSEVGFLLEEMQEKDTELVALKHKLQSRDLSIQRFPMKHASQQSQNGVNASPSLLIPNPKEKELIEYIRKGWERLDKLQAEKIVLAERALHLVTRHLNRLNSEIDKYQIVLPQTPLSLDSPSGLVNAVSLPSFNGIPTFSLPSTPLGDDLSMSRGQKRKSGYSTPSASLPGGIAVPQLPISATSPLGGPIAGSHRPHRPSRLSTSISAMPSPGAITSAAMTAANRSTLNKRNKRVVDEEDEDVGEDEVMANAEGAESVESTVAADDQVYCFCQKPSHGLMVGCDSQSCPYEWFHLECVGLSEAPAGTWYCSHCSAQENTKKKGRTGDSSNRARRK